MASPTKEAEGNFSFATQNFSALQGDKDPSIHNMHMSRGLLNLAKGLENLSIGVRATYMLLEEVQKELRELKSR